MYEGCYKINVTCVLPRENRAISTQNHIESMACSLERGMCHCVVIFFWSSGIMECTCIMFTFKKGVPLMRWGTLVVRHHSLLLMNSFNKTEAAVFSCRLCFLRAFPFISLIILLFLFRKTLVILT